jgi:acetyl/propionyl-CoA carboxylase alpha subunit
MHLRNITKYFFGKSKMCKKAGISTRTGLNFPLELYIMGHKILIVIQQRKQGLMNGKPSRQAVEKVGINDYICGMLKIKDSKGKEHQVEFTDSTRAAGTLNGSAFSWDVIEVKEGSFHVIKDNCSYTVEIVKADAETKSFVISVNGNKYTLEVKDRYDDLLHSLGMDNAGSGKVSEMKAPMPGLVLDVRVDEGTAVKKGDALLVLEAMKMENILKSPADGIVKKVNVKKGAAVEKNQVLISFA